VARAFFPLDEELGLVAGQLTPLLAESLVRLGSWLPFAPAATMVAFFTQTQVAPSSVRRMTQATGRAAEDCLSQTTEAGASSTVPLPAQDPVLHLYLGVDGAMVPLVGGVWAEVKTVTLGEVAGRVQEGGEALLRTRNLSYFSRLAEADRFLDLAQPELTRRQVAQAGHVSALADGARWIQAFFDKASPTATRILDFAHAAGYLAQAADAFWPEQPSAQEAWFVAQRHELKTGNPLLVIAELHRLALAAHDASLSTDRQATIANAHDYLKARLPLIQYAQFQRDGHPIGSGASESANKLVVERRLKGAGMQWERTNINPMLTLTNTVANDRWAELWPAATQQQRTARRQRLLDRHAPPPPDPPPPPPPPEKAPYRPDEKHPWRRRFMPAHRVRPAA